MRFPNTFLITIVLRWNKILDWLNFGVIINFCFQCFWSSNDEVPLAIHDYRHEYPELPKHPVPKEDVTSPSSTLYHQPKTQPSLQTMIPDSMVEMEPVGKFTIWKIYCLAKSFGNNFNDYHYKSSNLSLIIFD